MRKRPATPRGDTLEVLLVRKDQKGIFFRLSQHRKLRRARRATFSSSFAQEALSVHLLSAMSREHSAVPMDDVEELLMESSEAG